MENELKKFGKRLAELRNKHNLTQDKLAEKLGYSINHISKLELAKTNPSFDLLVKIADTMNIEIKDLFDFQNTISENELRGKISKIIDKADKEELELIYNLHKIIKKI